jgi:hypothetical protein
MRNFTKKAIVFGVPAVLVVIAVFFILARMRYPKRETYSSLKGMRGAQVRSLANRRRMLAEYMELVGDLNVGLTKAIQVQNAGVFAAGYGPQRRGKDEMDVVTGASSVVNGIQQVRVRDDDQNPGYATIEAGVLTLPYYVKTAKGNAINMSRSSAAHHLLYAVAAETAKRGASTTMYASFVLNNMAADPDGLGWTYLANKQRPRVKA